MKQNYPPYFDPALAEPTGEDVQPTSNADGPDEVNAEQMTPTSSEPDQPTCPSSQRPQCHRAPPKRLLNYKYTLVD